MHISNCERFKLETPYATFAIVDSRKNASEIEGKKKILKRCFNAVITQMDLIIYVGSWTPVSTERYADIFVPGGRPPRCVMPLEGNLPPLPRVDDDVEVGG